MAWLERARVQAARERSQMGPDRNEKLTKDAAWHIICLPLPAVARSEQQRFFALFKDALCAYRREPGEMDLSLFFYYGLSPEEALTALEDRLDLVASSQEVLAQHGGVSQCWTR